MAGKRRQYQVLRQRLGGHDRSEDQLLQDRQRQQRRFPELPDEQFPLQQIHLRYQGLD